MKSAVWELGDKFSERQKILDHIVRWERGFPYSQLPGLVQAEDKPLGKRTEGMSWQILWLLGSPGELSASAVRHTRPAGEGVGSALHYDIFKINHQRMKTAGDLSEYV